MAGTWPTTGALDRLAPLGYASNGGDGFQAETFLKERYAEAGRSSSALALYYRLKPWLPRSLQLAVRRAHGRRARERHAQGGRFPHWPIEPILVERMEEHLRGRLAESGQERVPFIGLWPDGRRFAYILTHDIESAPRLEQVQALLDVERRHGMVSSWNIVAEDYVVDPEVLETIRDAGGEIGLHGLRHDGRLFESRSTFERALPAIRRQLDALGADGFRSPSTLRNAAWMHELGARYDSSFPDTDPFQPQPGGCCSILPYFLGDVVELPITLVQDHTLFEILRGDASLWREKAGWIARHGGLVTALVHPDYVTPERLRAYDDLLGYLAELPGGWHALPRDVGLWWRRRAALEERVARGERVDEATLSAAGAGIAWAREDAGRIVIDIEEPA